MPGEKGWMPPGPIRVPQSHACWLVPSLHSRFACKPVPKREAWSKRLWSEDSCLSLSTTFLDLGMLVSRYEMWSVNTVHSINIYLTLRGLWLVLKANKCMSSTNKHPWEHVADPGGALCSLSEALQCLLVLEQMSGTDFWFCHLWAV